MMQKQVEYGQVGMASLATYGHVWPTYGSVWFSKVWFSMSSGKVWLRYGSGMAQIWLRYGKWSGKSKNHRAHLPFHPSHIQPCRAYHENQGNNTTQKQKNKKTNNITRLDSRHEPASQALILSCCDGWTETRRPHEPMARASPEDPYLLYVTQPAECLPRHLHISWPPAGSI